MSDTAWWQEIEGPEACSRPAVHWIAVYRDLERTLAAIMLENPDAAPRLWEVRRRLRHWETEAHRLSERAAEPSRMEHLG